jgi:hypothetical protein
LSRINKAVLAQCVGQDGGAKTDQFLTDPRDCHFDPAGDLGRERHGPGDDPGHQVRQRHAAHGADDTAALRSSRSRSNSGRGSTNDAANFTCITDERDFNQTPAPQIGP